VLYINLELSEEPFRERLEECICAHTYEGSEIEGLLVNFDHWTLRNRAEAYNIIIPKIIEVIESESYGLVIIDPIYKILGEADENNAGDITKLMSELGKAAERTSAAIAFAHYMARKIKLNGSLRVLRRPFGNRTSMRQVGPEWKAFPSGNPLG
jgi:RecA-family ATPase